jgi:hypothetical protein
MGTIKIEEGNGNTRWIRRGFHFFGFFETTISLVPGREIQGNMHEISRFSLGNISTLGFHGASQVAAPTIHTNRNRRGDR